MEYFIAFLEGIITFISPCLLPMLPLYVSYFAGQEEEQTKKNTLINALGFVLGFTIIFVLLGAFAGAMGSFLRNHTTLVNIITGAIVILFGLNFMNIIKIPFLNANRSLQMKHNPAGFFSSILFGMIFSIGWTPCVSAFLGSALMMAASSNHMGEGVMMLLSFSMGLGIPFIVTALLLDQLKSTFQFIKKHYKVVHILSGGLLVIIGILMMTGLMGQFLSLLTF